MILSLDTDSYGFHTHLDNGTYYSFTASKKVDVEERRIAAYRDAKKLFLLWLNYGIGSLGNDVFCEEPLALKNGKTTRVLCLMAGAVWAAHVEVCLMHGIDSHWHWVDVSSWKKRIVGNGNANKEMIRNFCLGSRMFAGDSYESRRPHGYDADHEANKNLYDAWCILQYGRWFKEQT